MILVDTSALIGFLKGEDNDASRKLRNVLENRMPFGITSQIFQEVLQGAGSKTEYEKLKRYLESQRFFHPKDPIASYALAARIYFDCRKKGITLRSTIDCLIAQIALEHDLSLLHNDRDFEAMTAAIPLKQF
jgi:predicted nucleic acid-binding protein